MLEELDHTELRIVESASQEQKKVRHFDISASRCHSSPKSLKSGVRLKPEVKICLDLFLSGVNQILFCGCLFGSTLNLYLWVAVLRHVACLL